jgi:hypothetical protein
MDALWNAGLGGVAILFALVLIVSAVRVLR